jgi:hypothetical protein
MRRRRFVNCYVANSIASSSTGRTSEAKSIQLQGSTNLVASYCVSRARTERWLRLFGQIPRSDKWKDLPPDQLEQGYSA